MKPNENSQPISESKLEERYDELLDEVYGTVKIGAYEYNTSTALYRVDETAYRVGFSDWLSSEVEEGNLIEFEGEYYEPSDCDEVES